MTDIKALFERQARWQKSLRDLPWPEKIRMAAKLRKSIPELRKGAVKSGKQPPGRD